MATFIPEVKSPVRSVRAADIVWSCIIIVLLTNLAPAIFLKPAGAVAGIVFLFLGCSAIVPLRKGFYSVMSNREARGSELSWIVLSLLLAGISLWVWKPLFTFTDKAWLPWRDDKISTAWELVSLWCANTALFGYGFFMMKRMDVAVSEINDGIRSGLVKVETSSPLSLPEEGKRIVVINPENNTVREVSASGIARDFHRN